MASTVFPAPSAGGKTMFRTTLTSGTSYTVPAGVTYLNVTLVGGGGGGSEGASETYQKSGDGLGGQIVHSTLSVTAGATISYAIGAGGAGGYYDSQSGNISAATGGTTTFTGATSASGGNGGPRWNQSGNPGRQGLVSSNGGLSSGGANGGSGGAGGSGCIVVEYWV